MWYQTVFCSIILQLLHTEELFGQAGLITLGMVARGVVECLILLLNSGKRELGFTVLLMEFTYESMVLDYI